jgi:hypothetical protein
MAIPEPTAVAMLETQRFLFALTGCAGRNHPDARYRWKLGFT